MSKRYYIRTGRSIEEILVRRKLEQQEQQQLGDSVQGAGGTIASKNLPPLRASFESAKSGGYVPQASPAQIEIARLNDVVRGSRPKKQTIQFSQSQPLPYPSPSPSPSLQSHAQFQQVPPQQQYAFPLDEPIIPPSYPYPTLEDRVRDREKQDMINVLAAEYKQLTSRIQELEQMVSAHEFEEKQKRKQAQRAKQELLIQQYLEAGYTYDQLIERFPNMSRTLSAKKMLAEPEIDMAALDLSEKVTRVDQRVTYLQKVFRSAGKLDAKTKAAIKIQKIMRGALVRKRFAVFLRSLHQWKVHKFRWVSVIIDKMMSLHAPKVVRMEQLRHNQQSHWLKVVFTKWMSVTKQFLALRRYVRQRANEMIVAKQVSLLRFVFRQFVEVTIGELSIRGVNKKRAQLVESIRQEISAKLIRRGELGVVPKFEVEKVLYRRVLLQFLDGKRILVMKRLFQRIKLLRSMAKKFAESARKWWFRKRAGSCFYSWSDYTYRVRSHHNRKRWLAPRQYELPYSQRQVDMFARRRAILYAFKPWKAFHVVRMKVNRSFNSKLLAFKRKMFDIMKEAVQANRKYRIGVIENWKGYANLIVTKPFRAWKDHIAAVRNKHNEQAQIVNAYVRWKKRLYLQLILRTWRHQAIFGRVVGMYPVTKLLKSLSDEKSHAVALQKRISGETVALEELNANLGKEINKTRELETRMTMLGLDINRQKMIVHHAVQESARLTAIIEAIAIINPHQVEHLKLLDPTFVLKENGSPAVSLAEMAEANAAKGPVFADDDDHKPTDTLASAQPETLSVSPTSRAMRKSGFGRSESGAGSVKYRNTQRRDRVLTEQMVQRKVEHAVEMVKRTRWLLARLDEEGKAKAQQAEAAADALTTERRAEMEKSPTSPRNGNPFSDEKNGDILLAPSDTDVDSWAFAWERQEFYYLEGERKGKNIKIVTPDHEPPSDANDVTKPKFGMDDEIDSDEERREEDIKEDVEYATNMFAHRTRLSKARASAAKRSGRLSTMRSPSPTGSTGSFVRGRETIVFGSPAMVGRNSPSPQTPAQASNRSPASRASLMSSRPPSRQSVLINSTSPATASTKSGVPPGTIPFNANPNVSPAAAAISRTSSGRMPSFISRGSSSKESGPFSPTRAGSPESMKSALFQHFSESGGRKTPSKPIDPTEEIEELEGAGAQTLLAVLDFIMHGEASGFVESDRKAWKHYIDPTPPPSPAPPEPEPDPNQAEGGDGSIGDDISIVSDATGGNASSLPPEPPTTTTPSATPVMSGADGSSTPVPERKTVVIVSRQASNTSDLSRASSTAQPAASGDMLPSQIVSRALSGDSRSSSSMAIETGAFSRKESGMTISRGASMWGDEEFDDEDEDESRRRKRKAAKRKAREDRLAAEKIKAEEKLKPKSWFQVVDALRINRPGPGATFHAAEVEAKQPQPNKLLKFTALAHVRENMARVLTWEEWKKVNQVPNRRRPKRPSQIEEETRIALEEDTSDDDDFDEHH